MHFTESLMLAGLKPSIGIVGDALDNGPGGKHNWAGRPPTGAEAEDYARVRASNGGER